MAVLLIERHDWETSGSGHQIQVPKAASAQFFGLPRARRRTAANIFDPPTALASTVQPFLLSYYSHSDTYRFNRIMQFGQMRHAVIAIEETHNQMVPYNIWWFLGPNATAILARAFPWQQAKGNQYGSGRRWTIIQAPGPRIP